MPYDLNIVHQNKSHLHNDVISEVFFPCIFYISEMSTITIYYVSINIYLKTKCIYLLLLYIDKIYYLEKIYLHLFHKNIYLISMLKGDGLLFAVSLSFIGSFERPISLCLSPFSAVSTFPFLIFEIL